MCAVAKKLRPPLVVGADDLGSLADMVEAARKEGVEDLVLDPRPSGLKELLERCTIIRRSAIRKTFRGFGYPIYLAIPAGRDGMLMASTAVMKYGSLLSFEELPASNALPLMVLRQNIYTDPQVPIQVKPDLYPVNNPGPDAPLLFTTNFSLTFFTVMSDLEKSKVPVWLQVVDTEGLSMLTTYSAGKLTAESVKNALLATGAMERSRTGTLVIPGMVARIGRQAQRGHGLRDRRRPQGILRAAEVPEVLIVRLDDNRLEIIIIRHGVMFPTSPRWISDAARTLRPEPAWPATIPGPAAGAAAMAPAKPTRSVSAAAVPAVPAAAAAISALPATAILPAAKEEAEHHAHRGRGGGGGDPPGRLPGGALLA
jgi:hypothetical protein